MGFVSPASTVVANAQPRAERLLIPSLTRTDQPNAMSVDGIGAIRICQRRVPIPLWDSGVFEPNPMRFCGGFMKFSPCLQRYCEGRISHLYLFKGIGMLTLAMHERYTVT